GVEPAYVDRLIELGIITDTHSDVGAVRRVRVVEGLEQGGLPLEALAEAIRRGDLSLDFVDQPSYDVFAALGPATFRGLSQRHGLPLELVLAAREASGAATPSPEDLVRESELPLIDWLRVKVAHGVRPEIIGQSLRAYGEAMRRVAETEADWWRSDVLGPL